MRNALLIVLLWGGLCTLLPAQVPTGFSYQAVARDSSGACLSDRLISLRISIEDDSAATSPIYQELFPNVQTNAVGHFQVIIGSGQLQGGSPAFETLSWNSTLQSRSLKVELSPNNDLNLQVVGTVPIYAIPYAVAASNGKQFSHVNEDEFIIFYGKNGEANASIGGLPDLNGDRNMGVLRLFDDLGNETVRIFGSSASTLPGGAGWIHLFGENGSRNVELSMRNAVDDPNLGAIRLRDENDASRVEFTINPLGAGSATYRGANGNLNVAIGNSGNTSDYGALTVRDDQGTSQVSLFIDGNGNGNVAADLKPFFMDHPTKPGYEIWYCAIEGPEAAAYERGTVELVDGRAEVRFSDHFELVANPNTLTIMLTPWSAESQGLAVVERSSTGFVVQELRGGTGRYRVDWEAKAVRKNHENWQVVRKKEPDPYADHNSETE